MGSRDHTLAIAAALRELERRLELLVQALSYESAPFSVEHARTEREARRLVCEAYATIDYAPDDQVNESPVCLGVIGGSAAKVALRELQRSDLSLLAAYRQIPVLTGRVKRVACTRARTRAVYRKDRDAITALLQGQDRPGTEDELARLKRLPARETHLALVKEHHANVRANVWFSGLDARSRGLVMVSAELPLLYPLGRSKEIPEIKYPAVEEGALQPARKRAGKLEDEPFLDTLPVFRYRPAPSRRLGR